MAHRPQPQPPDGTVILEPVKDNELNGIEEPHKLTRQHKCSCPGCKKFAHEEGTDEVVCLRRQVSERTEECLLGTWHFILRCQPT